MMRQKILYLDMDGVLADFHNRFRALFDEQPPIYEKIYGPDAFWKALRDNSPFFYGLEKTRCCDSIIEIAEMQFVPLGYEIQILTACPTTRENYPDAEDEKERWVRDVLKRDWKVNTVRGGAAKAVYAMPDDILVDDHARNIRQWNEAGGTGIWMKENDPSLGMISMIHLAGLMRQEQEEAYEKVKEALSKLSLDLQLAPKFNPLGNVAFDEAGLPMLVGYPEDAPKITVLKERKGAGEFYLQASGVNVGRSSEEV